MTNALQIGSYVSIFLPRDERTARGTVEKIEEPPRKLTGGRGIGVRLNDGSYVDGWDVTDVHVIADPS